MSEEEILTFIFGTFLVIISVICLVLLIFYLIKAVGRYKMFKKANIEGWKAFIPIYNTVLECELSGVSTNWVIVSVGLSFCMFFLGPLAIIAVAGQLYFSIILALSLAKSYGKSESFGIGLLFLGPIFYPILGFDKSEYIGPKPMNDFVFGPKNSTDDSNKQTDQEIRCIRCGSPLSKEDKFCPQCGESQYVPESKEETK